jgi:hypothetical protein
MKSRKIWVGHVARMGEMKETFRSLVGRGEAKRPFGRPRLRWLDNIKMDLDGTGYRGVNWIQPPRN